MARCGYLCGRLGLSSSGTGTVGFRNLNDRFIAVSRLNEIALNWLVYKRSTPRDLLLVSAIQFPTSNLQPTTLIINSLSRMEVCPYDETFNH